MTILLGCKIIGGLLVSVAHRYIVRVAKKEGLWWGIAAMFVPGFSIFFAVLHRVDLKKPLVVQVCGFTLLLASFTIMATKTATETSALVAAAKKTAAAEDASTATEAATPAPQVETLEQKTARLNAWFKQLEAKRATLKTTSQVNAFNAETKQYEALMREVEEQSRNASPADQVAYLTTWYQALN